MKIENRRKGKGVKKRDRSKEARVKSLDQFELDKSRFIKWDCKFVVKRFGSSREIFIKSDDGTLTKVKAKYIDTRKRKPGMHICWMVRRDIENRIKSGEYTLKEYPKGYRPQTVFYNAEHIRANLYKEVIAIDMSSCYFNTAHLVSMISDRVHALGHKKDREWKEARNISIGSLGKRVSYDIYEPGKPIITTGVTDNLSSARTHVLEHVELVAKQIFRACYKGWMMYLTDCFYVLPEYADKVKKELAKHGYHKTTEKRVYFKLVQQYGVVADKVYWEDLDKPKKKRGRKKNTEQTTASLLSKKDEKEHYHSFNNTKNQFIIK